MNEKITLILKNNNIKSMSVLDEKSLSLFVKDLVKIDEYKKESFKFIQNVCDAMINLGFNRDFVFGFNDFKENNLYDKIIDSWFYKK